MIIENNHRRFDPAIAATSNPAPIIHKVARILLIFMRTPY
jgi:hypothetical protein